MSRTLLAMALALGACAESASGPSIRMDFAAEEFYAAPFPSDHRRHADGTVDTHAFPGGASQPFVDKTLAELDGRATGFSRSAAVFFAAEAPIDATSLPDLAGSMLPDASAYLINVDDPSRHPVSVRFLADGGPYGAANLLALLPLQGMPLEPATRYAAVVTTGVRLADGQALARAPALEALIGGDSAGLSGEALATYRAAIDALRASGELERAAAVAAFTTGDPTEELHTLVEHARSLPVPAPTLTLGEVFDDFCVLSGVLDMPVYQSGEPPYSEAGGAILWEDGVPVLDHHEAARIVVTIPRAEMPVDGWPVLTMIRTGGGGDRPLVDRGVRSEPGGATEPGTGPALELARAGYAGVSLDGPHGGMRNITGGDEQFLIFNVTNPVAMRDNIRQSALELALVPAILDALILDTSGCPGSSATAQFDAARHAIFGHSMGGTIAPLVLAAEPRFGAAILSGAGGSWIQNVVHKRSPVPVKPFAELLVGYTSLGISVHEHDPILSMFQWAAESADPPLYAEDILARSSPPHVLMLQGIVDTYILPPIANATSLSLRLDLAGDPLDTDVEGFTSLTDLLPLSGREPIALPAFDNQDGTTAIVVQHPEDGIEDGHEVVYQTEPPKHQYRCFLETWLAGAPRVPAGDSTSCE